MSLIEKKEQEEQQEEGIINVYAVNFSGLDFSLAERFGNLIFLTKGVLNLNKIDEYKAKIQSQLEDSIADDFLLFSGQSLVCATALHIWLTKHKKCNLLLWDNHKKTYNHYTIRE